MNKNFFVFPKGIPGFEKHKKYNLMRDTDSPLAQLVAVDDNNIGFILIPPEIFFSDYSFEIDNESKAILREAENAEFEVLNILTYHSDLTKASINLRAPVLLNLKEKIGLQLIINDEKYSSKQPLPLKPTSLEGVVK